MWSSPVQQVRQGSLGAQRVGSQEDKPMRPLAPTVETTAAKIGTLFEPYMKTSMTDFEYEKLCKAVESEIKKLANEINREKKARKKKE